MKRFLSQSTNGALHLFRDFDDRRPRLRVLLEVSQISGSPFAPQWLLLLGFRLQLDNSVTWETALLAASRSHDN